jgi:two-component system chemotaxis response regulator CheY
MALAQPVLYVGLRAMKILIAEDTDSVRYALRLVLEYLGHEVVGIATDGEDVLQKCANKQPELVLMDVRMPRMDGLTCTTLLTQREPGTKVVIVTAGHATESEARAAGALGFVEKPFEVSRLNEVIDSVTAP